MVDAEAAKRRERARKPSNRPSRYLYSGLREETTTVYPEGIDIEQYDIIGQDVTRTLRTRPAELWVECVIRPILRRKGEKDALNPEIVQAPAPRPVLGGNHVGADLLAQLVVNKYWYHLPEYRQIRMFAEKGLTLPRSTVNNWIHGVAQVLYPLYLSQCAVVREGGYLQVDEVPWKIADRKGKPCRNGYAWQFRDAGRSSRDTFFYYYKGSRAGEIARTQLKDYHGIIQTDGYKVYDYFENVLGITNLACWAHVRRKFVEAQASNPKAGEALKYIATLYALEENLRSEDASVERILAARRQYAVPILEGIHAWMQLVYKECTPQDPLGKAIVYALKLWPRLVRYTEDGRCQIDSNPVERGQRPTVLGRKNYLFSQSDDGAEDNAVFYSLLVSCDIVGVNPAEWMVSTLEKLRPDMSDGQLRQLLPYNYKAEP